MKKLGQILITEKVITEQQLNFALYVQGLEKEKSGRQRLIGHILLDMDCVVVDDIASALGSQKYEIRRALERNKIMESHIESIQKREDYKNVDEVLTAIIQFILEQKGEDLLHTYIVHAKHYIALAAVA